MEYRTQCFPHFIFPRRNTQYSFSSPAQPLPMKTYTGQKLVVGRAVQLLLNYSVKNVFVKSCYIRMVTLLRLRWPRGSVLAFGTQVRGFKPDRSCWIFQGEKIISTPSFGREVKPSVPCRRFTASKRSLNVTWPFLAHAVPPLAAGIS